jgi:hypothetical protein
LVAAECGMTEREICGDGRTADAVRARFAIAWALHHATGRSDAHIGRHLGDRDHSTIHNARARADELRRGCLEFRALTDRLLATITEPMAQLLSDDGYGWEDLRHLTKLDAATCKRIMRGQP